MAGEDLEEVQEAQNFPLEESHPKIGRGERLLEQSLQSNHLDFPVGFEALFANLGSSVEIDIQVVYLERALLFEGGDHFLDFSQLDLIDVLQSLALIERVTLLCRQSHFQLLPLPNGDSFR